MTVEEALAVTWPHSYPPETYGVIFTPTPKLRELMGRLDSDSRASFVAAFARFRAGSGDDIRVAGLQQAAECFAALLAGGKGVEEAHREILRQYRDKGKQVIDRFFDERLRHYRSMIEAFGASGKGPKVEEYVRRIEMLLAWQIELDKSIKYR